MAIADRLMPVLMSPASVEAVFDVKTSLSKVSAMQPRPTRTTPRRLQKRTDISTTAV